MYSDLQAILWSFFPFQREDVAILELLNMVESLG